MTDTSIFDPRDLRCKRPFGAAASGTPVEFTLRPLRREGWSRAVLRARFEFWENEILTVPAPDGKLTPAAIQPIQARRTEAPMTQATYSRTKPAVRPVEGRRLLRRGVEVRSRAPPRDPSVRWSLAS